MVKILKYYFVCVVLCLLSCSKYTDEEILIADDSKPSGDIYYQARGVVIDSAGTTVYRSYFQGIGQFYKSNLRLSYQWENVGALGIGNLQIPFDENYIAYNFNAKLVTDPVNALQFGRKLTFGLSGGGSYPTASTVLYVPKVIYILSTSDTGCVCNKQHSKKDDLKITWNTDPNNSQIEYSVNYDGISSHSSDTTLTNRSYYNTPKLISDNGSYTIAASEFSEFKKGSVVIIRIRRAGEGLLTSGKHLVTVVGETISEVSVKLSD